MSSDLSEALAARVGAINTARMLLGRSGRADTQLDLSRSYEELVAAYPQLDWVAMADATGRVVRSNGSLREGSRVDSSHWFVAGLKAPWVGVIEDTHDATQGSAPTTPSDIGALGDMSIPFHDNNGHLVGVVAAHLSWRRTPDHAPRLTDETDLPRHDPGVCSQCCRCGPHWARDQPRSTVELVSESVAPRTVVAGDSPISTAYPVFERLTDGRRVLVSRASLSTAPELASFGLQVLLSEPNERVYQRANAVTRGNPMGVALDRSRHCAHWGARHSAPYSTTGAADSLRGIGSTQRHRHHRRARRYR